MIKRTLGLVILLSSISSYVEAEEGFHPFKEMQTIPNSARITVSSHFKTIFQDRDGAMGTIYLDSQKMGRFSKEEPAFTQEVQPGKHSLEVCQHMWYPGDDTKWQCVKMEINTESNTLYSTTFRATLPLFGDTFTYSLDAPAVIPF